MSYTLADFTEHRMPSGAKLYYRDEDHSYWEAVKPKRKRDAENPDAEWGGTGRLTGVTTIVAPFEWTPGGLMRWAVKVNLEAMAELLATDLDDSQVQFDPRTHLEWATTIESIERRLKSLSIERHWPDEEIRDEAGERGSNVHYHVLNALAAGEPMPAMAELSDEEKGYAEGVIKFWLDHNPHPHQAEQIVYDPGLAVAGRLDFRGHLTTACERPGCPCREWIEATTIIDLKTGNWIGATSHVQTAGYDHLARTSGYGASRAQLILKVTEDGSYELIQGHATSADFLTAIEVYRRAGLINKAAAADRRSREEK